MNCWPVPDVGCLDRYAILLGMERCTSVDMDRSVIMALMTWWLRQDISLRHTRIDQYCWYCGQQGSHGTRQLCYDHAFPEYYTSTPLVPCCYRCNSQKRHLTPHAYRRFHLGGTFWFERVGLAQSPLGYALCEDITGFRTVLACYLIHQAHTVAPY